MPSSFPHTAIPPMSLFVTPFCLCVACSFRCARLFSRHIILFQSSQSGKTRSENSPSERYLQLLFQLGFTPVQHLENMHLLIRDCADLLTLLPQWLSFAMLGKLEAFSLYLQSHVVLGSTHWTFSLQMNVVDECLQNLTLSTV